MSGRPLLEKLETFARGVIDFHSENPHLAAFVERALTARPTS
jgi:hypothetical protein